MKEENKQARKYLNILKPNLNFNLNFPFQIKGVNLFVLFLSLRFFIFNSRPYCFSTVNLGLPLESGRPYHYSEFFSDFLLSIFLVDANYDSQYLARLLTDIFENFRSDNMPCDFVVS